MILEIGAKLLGWGGMGACNLVYLVYFFFLYFFFFVLSSIDE